MFFGQATEVDDGVAHTTQGRVDADAGAGRNVFEVALAVVAQDNDTTLLGRQHLDQLANALAGLLAHDGMLDVLLLDAQRIYHVALGLVGDDGHLVVATVVVDNEVVGDAHDPMDEFVFILVDALAERHDNLEECVLENVVGDIFVFDDRKNVAINLRLITRKQLLETGIITVLVTFNQLIVGEFSQ